MPPFPALLFPTRLKSSEHNLKYVANNHTTRHSRLIPLNPVRTSPSPQCQHPLMPNLALRLSCVSFLVEDLGSYTGPDGCLRSVAWLSHESDRVNDRGLAYFPGERVSARSNKRLK
jgi:hypothetical protein